MSDENGTTDDGNDSEGVKNLRKQFDIQKKQLQDALDKLNGYETKDRQNAVGDILKAKGVNASAARFYTGDDTSEAAVNKWLDDNKDVFGPSTQEQPTPEIDPQVALVNAALQGSKLPEAADLTQTIGNPEELQKMIQTLPFEELQKMGLMPKSGQLGVR